MPGPATPVVCVLGGPGSGKTMVAEAIQAAVGATVIFGGRLLRDLATRGGESRNQAQRIIATGAPIPVDLYCRLAEGHHHEPGRWLVLDGYPRTRAQFDGLPRVCRSLGVHGPCFIGAFLTAPPDLLRKRIETRGRVDDGDPALVTSRMALYDAHAAEVRRLFRANGHALTLAGDGRVDEIVAQIVRFSPVSEPRC